MAHHVSLDPIQRRSKLEPRDNNKYYILGALCGIVLVFGTAGASVYLFEDKIQSAYEMGEDRTIGTHAVGDHEYADDDFVGNKSHVSPQNPSGSPTPAP